MMEPVTIMDWSGSQRGIISIVAYFGLIPSHLPPTNFGVRAAS